MCIGTKLKDKIVKLSDICHNVVVTISDVRLWPFKLYHLPRVHRHALLRHVEVRGELGELLLVLGHLLYHLKTKSMLLQISMAILSPNRRNIGITVIHAKCSEEIILSPQILHLLLHCHFIHH